MTTTTKRDHGRGPNPVQGDGDRLEALVMTVVMAEYPTRISLEELGLELANGSLEDGELGIVESAVFELARKGLLHRPDGSGLITPARAIVRYEELLDLSNA